MSPRPARPWFRFYVEAMRDPKMRRLTAAQRWLWVAVLSAARESCEPGRLVIAAGVPMGPSDLADYAGMRRPEVLDGVGVMTELGMVTDDHGTWVVSKWMERQYESDNTTERTRKHRSSEQGRNVPTTSIGTPPETETETETEKRLAPSPNGPGKKCGTRIPDQFDVSPEMESWARSKAPDVDWRIQTEKFVNHWKAKSGKDATKLDWERTWRNWLLTAQEWTTSKSAVRTHL